MLDVVDVTAWLITQVWTVRRLDSLADKPSVDSLASRQSRDDM